MLSKQELDAALAAERAMYRALSEVQDITRELLDAVDRQDQGIGAAVFEHASGADQPA